MKTKTVKLLGTIIFILMILPCSEDYQFVGNSKSILKSEVCLTQQGVNQGTERYRYSDVDLKENITNVTNSLDKIQQLRPVTYTYKQTIDAIPQAAIDSLAQIEGVSPLIIESRMLVPPEEPKQEIGFIAQELQTVFPTIVSTDVSGNLYIDYIAIIPLMVKSIQEQQVLIEQLQAEVAELKK